MAPWEIAQMEQRLIAEGMPETEIKSLCDVHVEVFKEALEHKTVPGLPAGHPVHTLMLENRACGGHFERSGGNKGLCEGEGQAARDPRASLPD